MSSIKFGTSGLRGLVTDLLGWPAYSYTLAFCRMLIDSGAVSAGGTVLVGRDLRDSSPAISALCRSAVEAAGMVALDCGALPTPALALYAMTYSAPAVMVTGSHIPDDRNGLKFYRADGEIGKVDEAPISRNQADLPVTAVSPPRPAVHIGDAALELYRRRYLDFFGSGALAGLKIGVYQHSSVARDVLVDLLEGLGAEAVPLGRSDRFIPVDTEALRPEDVELLRHWAGADRLAAIVSTDGDADRPLIADERGRFLRGDLVGTLTAIRLGADTVVTPVTSNFAIEATGRFAHVERTRVGSPFVIEAMRAVEGNGPVVGFEANGGVLLGTDAFANSRRLLALPTRDAALPILCVLAELARRDEPLSTIAAALGFKAAAADRLQDVPGVSSQAFLHRLWGEAQFRNDAFAPLGGVADVNGLDGIRVTTARGEIVHFRASGNAPELRCYVEGETEARAVELLGWGLALAASETRGM